MADDEIDLKELFGALWRRKGLILLTTVVVAALAWVFAYFAQNVYQTYATVEIAAERKAAGNMANMDMVALAMGGASGSSLSNEVEILKSRFIAQKALAELTIGTRYFTTRNLKTLELYRATPFVVAVDWMEPQLHGQALQLRPVDANRFELVLEPSWGQRLQTALGLSTHAQTFDFPDYRQLHAYGEKIITPWFQLSVTRVHDLADAAYRFSYTPNLLMYDFIAKGLTVAPLSKDAELLKVSFEDSVPERARDIVQALTEAYLRQEVERNTQEADKVLSFIDVQLEAINDSLQQSALNLEQYKSENKLVDLSVQAEMAAGSLSDLEQKVYALDIELGVLESVQAYLLNNEDVSGVVLGASVDSPGLEKLISALQERMTERQSLLTEFTELHPDVLKLTEAIKELKRTIIASVDNKLAALKERKSSLNRVIEQQKNALEQLPEQEKQLARLMRHYTV
jgi:uncharacterized protein involved in exopolysaccharide biosynthesis